MVGKGTKDGRDTVNVLYALADAIAKTEDPVHAALLQQRFVDFLEEERLREILEADHVELNQPCEDTLEISLSEAIKASSELEPLHKIAETIEQTAK